MQTCSIPPIWPGRSKRIAANSGRIASPLPRAGNPCSSQTSAPGLHLWVFEGNIAARQFYARLGGREVERCLETELPTPPETFILRVFWPDLAMLGA